MTYILELPWGKEGQYVQFKYKDFIKNLGKGLYAFNHPELPQELHQYSTLDFSYARWYEDDMRLKAGLRRRGIQKGKAVFTPRPHQKEGAQKIFTSYQKGCSGFLLADSTGLGKTLTALVGITATAKHAGFTEQQKAKLLIVAPKGVLPVWRQTLYNYPLSTKYCRPLIINYQQLNKLINEVKEPASKGKKKRKKSTRSKNRQTASKGTPKINWDYIIFDESQYLKNYGSSATSLAASNIAQLNTPYKKGKTPYTIFSTATPGSSPIHFSIMANWVAPLISESSGHGITPNTWGNFLEKQGFAVSKGKTGWTWAQTPWYGKNSKDPKERAKYLKAEKESKQVQRRDATRIGRALMKAGSPFIKRSPVDIADWPEQQCIPLPIELSAEQKPIYEEAWTRFRKWMKLNAKGSDPKGALVESLRYRQKSSMLKVDTVCEYIKDFVEQDKQVYVSLEFIEDIDMYREILEKAKIPVSEISGRNVNEREVERLKFQKGETKVVLCTVVAGISLHANETLPDGSQATPNERITIIHSIRQNPLDTNQSLGRSHRDSQNSIAYFPFLTDTIDERVIQSFVNKNSNMNTMIGQSQEKAEELEDIFRSHLEK